MAGGFFFTFSEGLAADWDVIGGGGGDNRHWLAVDSFFFTFSARDSLDGLVGTLLLPAGVVEVVVVMTETGWPLTASSSPSAPEAAGLLPDGLLLVMTVTGLSLAPSSPSEWFSALAGMLLLLVVV